jgi:hypothetical protein
MKNYMNNIQVKFITLSLLFCALPSSSNACIEHLLSWKTKTIPAPVPIIAPVVPKRFNYFNKLTATLNSFDYTAAKQSVAQACKTAGNFIKTTAQANPYRAAALGTGIAVAGCLWYQHGKHARLVKNLDGQKKYYLKRGKPVPPKLESELAIASKNVKDVENYSFNKHFAKLPRPAILIPMIIGGACAVALSIDIAKTSILTGGLSASRFLLPNHAINLLPIDTTMGATNFSGYWSIFKFARQQHFKSSDIIEKTLFGAGASSLLLASGWITLRNKQARKTSGNY